MAQFVAPYSVDSISTSLNNYDFEERFKGKQGEFIDTLPIHLVNQPPIFFNHSLNLGNIGSPNYFLIHQKLNRPIGFFGHFDGFDFIRFNKYNLTPYEVNKPFTEFSYLNGTNKEEMFSVHHTQRIRQKVNLGFKFRSLNSDGFYNRMRSQVRNFALYSSFLSSDKRYFLSSGFNYNKINFQENGGLLNNEEFIENELPRNLIGVQLELANNKSQTRQFYFDQGYQVFKNYSVDSLKDSTIVNSSLTLIHKFNYDQQAYLFTDLLPDSTFYAERNLGMVNENWSRRNVNEIQNFFGISFIGFDSTLYTQTGISNQFVQISDYINSNSFQNFIFETDLHKSFYNKTYLLLNYQQVVLGENIGDLKINFNFLFDLKKYYSIGFNYSLQNTDVPFIYQLFHSTSNSYSFNFNNEVVQEFKLNQTFFKFLQLNAGVGSINGGIYFSDAITPNQVNQNQDFSFFELKAEQEYSHFGFLLNNRWQYYESSAIFPLPRLVSFNRFYLKGWLFNHHLLCNLGVDLFFASEYSGFGYSPLTRQFFTSTSNERFGNYPFFDLFFAAKLKTGRVFIKASHINQGFSGNNFKTALGYPYHDFSLRFGFSWIFLN